MNIHVLMCMQGIMKGLCYGLEISLNDTVEAIKAISILCTRKLYMYLISIQTILYIYIGVRLCHLSKVRGALNLL